MTSSLAITLGSETYTGANREMELSESSNEWRIFYRKAASLWATLAASPTWPMLLASGLIHKPQSGNRHMSLLQPQNAKKGCHGFTVFGKAVLLGRLIESRRHGLVKEVQNRGNPDRYRFEIFCDHQPQVSL